LANERVTEGDVPRVQRVELSLEVLAADAERCGAVRQRSNATSDCAARRTRAAPLNGKPRFRPRGFGVGC
jgi:hypothetical protein